MTQRTPTCLWNDSAALSELTYSIENGAVGATCNPVIVLDVLKKEAAHWNDRIRTLDNEMRTVTEDQIAWKIVEEISAERAKLLIHIFREQNGKDGRLSVQTDPHFCRNSGAMLEQALRFHSLALNMIVKVAATEAGITAIEEATYRGISINAAVCFSLLQCVAVAEAVECGLQRRQRENNEIASISLHHHGRTPR
jgi:transaldolase